MILRDAVCRCENTLPPHIHLLKYCPL